MKTVGPLVLILALVVTACGGDSATTSAPTASTSTSGDGLSDDLEPIRGLLVLGMSEDIPEGQAGEPAAVVGDLIAADEEVRLCGVVMDSLPPQCSLPGSIVLQGVDLSSIPDLETAQGVSWSSNSIVAVGEWAGPQTVAVNRLVPIVLGERVAVGGVIEPQGDRWVLCTAPRVACDVTAVPLVGYSGPSSGGEPVIVIATWAGGGLEVQDVSADNG